MAGRRPKPTALHKLQGTFHTGKHRDRALEAVASGNLKHAPDDLTETQLAAWHYAIKHAPAGVLYAIDRDMLKLWVQTLDRHNEAQLLLEYERDSILWINSPAHRIIDKTTQLLVRLAAELGFSPAARPRLRIDSLKPNEADKADDPWAKLRLIPGGLGDA